MAKKIEFTIFILTIFLIISVTSVLAQDIDTEILYEDKEFRNPFIEYQEPAPQPPPTQGGNNAADAEPEEPVITFEMVRNELPFSLSGIISSNKERIALLNTGEGTQFIRGYYKEDGYELIAIQGESVIVRNRGFRLRLKIGGEIDEI